VQQSKRVHGITGVEVAARRTQYYSAVMSLLLSCQVQSVYQQSVLELLPRHQH
jgi:hypothetical protein